MEQPELPREAMDALDEIDRILHQMLVLAELSAGEGNVNRTNLQTVLEYLQNKINRAADRLEGTLATTVMGVMKGCAFVRVHDVKENVRAVRMTEAILRA